MGTACPSWIDGIMGRVRVALAVAVVSRTKAVPPLSRYRRRLVEDACVEPASTWPAGTTARSCVEVQMSVPKQVSMGITFLFRVVHWRCRVLWDGNAWPMEDRPGQNRASDLAGPAAIPSAPLPSRSCARGLRDPIVLHPVRRRDAGGVSASLSVRVAHLNGSSTPCVSSDSTGCTQSRSGRRDRAVGFRRVALVARDESCRVKRADRRSPTSSPTALSAWRSCGRDSSSPRRCDGQSA